MKKVLIVSTVSRQFYLFEQANIEVLKSLGYEVHAAANFNDVHERLDSLDIVRHHFDIRRSPFSLQNIKAYKQLKAIMKSTKFDVVHCHSPMGGVLGRLAARLCCIKRVIYTAHGFHFYKGAPLLNWLVYYPVEKFLARYTSVLITINREDYGRASGKFHAGHVCYVPGIGVDTNGTLKLHLDRRQKRLELKIPDDTIVLLSVGELNRGKNHGTALKALAMIQDHDFLYLICGRGFLEDNLRNLATELGIADRVRFLGYRNDILEICLASDMFVFPSYREGLPVSVMEAMSVGLPVVCSAIRGNADLIQDAEGGFLNEPKDISGFAKSIKKLLDEPDLRRRMGIRNIQYLKAFDKNAVKETMLRIYDGVIN